MQEGKNNTRRDFLKKLTLGVGGSAVALSACDSPQFDDFLQKNFKTLSKTDIEEIILV